MVGRYSLRAGIVLIVALVSWAVYVSSKQLTRNQRIESEVELLQVEADKIRRENETLTEKVQYFASNDFREQEAKEKLGMKKAGEEVVVIKSRPAAAPEAETAETVPASVPSSAEQRPNYEKWWRLFFQKL